MVSRWPNLSILKSPPRRAGASPAWLFLCLLAAPTLLAQRYSFKSYGPDEGLTTAVSRLFQDRDGFLWVGASNGLMR